MDCLEYIEQYLSADADDELSARERLLVEEHQRGCGECRARLAEERALKLSVRRHLGIVGAPADVRLRIRAALGELAEYGPAVRSRLAARASMFSRSDSSQRRLPHSVARERQGGGSGRGWFTTHFRRVQYLAPAGFVVIVLAASVVLFRGGFTGTFGRVVPNYQRSVPAFDFAIDRFNQLSQGFAPNVPAEAFSSDNGAYFAWVEEGDPLHHVSEQLPDISSSYEKMQMPPELCDFERAGYQLVGGRVDRLADGKPVTYTLYRNQNNSILSVGLKQRMGAPQGGYWFEAHALYSYRGYSLCLTIYPIGHFASIIVTRAPMLELLRDVAAADIAFVDR